MFVPFTAVLSLVGKPRHLAGLPWLVRLTGCAGGATTVLHTIAFLGLAKADLLERLRGTRRTGQPGYRRHVVATAANVSRVAVSAVPSIRNASIKPEKRDRILKVAQELNYSARHGGALHGHPAARTSSASSCRTSRARGKARRLDAMTTALQAEGFATLLFTHSAPTCRSRDAAHLHEGLQPGFGHRLYRERPPGRRSARVFDRAVPILHRLPHDEEEPAEGPRGRRMPRPVRPARRAAARGHRAGGRADAGLWARGASPISGRQAELLAPSPAAAWSARGAGRTRPGAPFVRIAGDYTYDTAYREDARTSSVSAKPVDAIFAANDVGAFGAIDALRNELGLRVPQDVKVVGFDDVHQRSWKSYSLTTVKLDIAERTQAAAAADPAPAEEPARPALARRNDPHPPRRARHGGLTANGQ